MVASSKKIGTHIILSLTSDSIGCVCKWTSKIPQGMTSCGEVKKVNFLMDEYNAHLKKHGKSSKR